MASALVAWSGLTTWGLVVMAVGVVVIPTFAIGHLPTTVTVSGTVYSINYSELLGRLLGACSAGLGAGLLSGMIGGNMPRSIDEPYLDLRETAVADARRKRRLQRSSGMASVPAGAPVTASNRMAAVGTVSQPSGRRATGPYFYEHH